MEDNKLDNLFRQSIEQFAESSADKVWNSLDAKLEKRLATKRRKKFFLFRLLPAGLFVLLSSGGYFYFSSVNSATKNNSVPSIAESKRIAEDKRNGIITPSSSDKDQVQSIEEGKRIAKANHDREIKEKQMAEGVKNALLPSTSSQPQNKKAEAGSNLAAREKQNTDAQKQPSQKNTLTDASSNNSNESSAANSSTENNSGTGSQTTSAPSQSNNGSTQNPADESAETKTTETTSSINSSSETKPPTETANPSSPENKAETPAPNAGGENQTALATTPAGVDSTPSPAEKKSFVKRVLSAIASNTSVEAFYSPEVVNRTLSSNTTYFKQGATENQTTNYNNEMSKYSFNTGAQFRYDIGKKWSLSAGLSFTAYGQTATYNYINIVTDSVYQEEHEHDEDNDGSGWGGWGGHHGEHHNHHGHHEGPGGTPGVTSTDHFVIYTSSGAIDLLDMPIVPGHNPNNDTIGLTSVVEHQIQFISIPVTVRYKFGAKKLSYYAETGVSLNFISSDDAEITIAGSYTETNTLDGLKKVNFNWLLGAGAQYALKDHWRFFIGPNFRYSLTSINENNPVLSYPYFIGIQSGVAFHF